MIEFLIICLLITFLISKILKHNLYVSDFKIKVKILGLDMQLSIKEKKHPS